MPLQRATSPGVDSLTERGAGALSPLTSGPELERVFQRRMFLFNVCFVLAMAPLYISAAIVRKDPINWAMMVLIFGGTAIIAPWTRRHGDHRRGLFWLQTVTFFSLFAGLCAAQHFNIDTPSFWWMTVIPVVTLMGGLTRLGVLQGLLVIVYVSVAFVEARAGTASLGSPALRLHMAVALSTIYVCANLLFAMFWRGKLQAALQDATQAALASAGAKARFLAHMSHEIRTPLAGVIGAAELLGSRRTNEAQRLQLAALQEQSAKTLLALINDILDWSKLEAGKVRLEQHPFSIRGLVGEVNELFAATAFGKQIELSHSCEAEVPRLLIGDPTRIRQVLGNLVGNAVKFTSKGSVHVHVTAARGSAGEPGQWLHIEVSDSGAGIAPDALGDVFDAFRQADESVTRRYGGTGLGLSISKELAELMGGRIEVISAAGEGSTFTLVLPLPAAEGQPPLPTLARHDELLVACASPGLMRHMRSLFNELRIEPRLCMGMPTPAELRGCRTLLLDAALPDAQAAATAAAAMGGFRLALLQSLGSELAIDGAVPLYKPVRSGALESFLEQPEAAPARAEATILAGGESDQGPHVLLCEDNPVNQVVVQVMLHELGATVVIADNGRIALDRLRRERFDLVLMDMQMPELDGLSAAREWRRLEASASPEAPRLPIICMTANSRADEGDAALAAGMDDFLAKPFGISDLKQCMARWVAQAAVRA